MSLVVELVVADSGLRVYGGWAVLRQNSDHKDNKKGRLGLRVFGLGRV